VGETTAYALTAGPLAPRVADLREPAVLRDKLEVLAGWTAAQIVGLGLPEDVVPGELVPPTVDAAVARLADIGRLLRIGGPELLPERAAAGPLVLEGAQGVLLDEWRGFHPYTTWSTTTAANARTLLDELGVAVDDTTTLGLVRTCTVRHGAGPHPTQDPALERVLVERHNLTNRWQEAFRIGTFDAVAHRYALEVCDVDALVVGHADWARAPFAAATSYRTPQGDWDRIVPGAFGDLEHQSRLTERLLRATGVVEHLAGDPADAVGALLERPVAMVSHGPRAADCAWRSSPRHSTAVRR
jgi:adenylosuccinate synthase